MTVLYDLDDQVRWPVGVANVAKPNCHLCAWLLQVLRDQRLDPRRKESRRDPNGPRYDRSDLHRGTHCINVPLGTAEKARRLRRAFRYYTDFLASGSYCCHLYTVFYRSN